MCAQSGAYGPDFREAATPEPISKNPPWKAGLHSPVARKLELFGDIELPRNREFSQAPFGVHRQSAPKISCFRVGCAATPEAPLPAVTALPIDPVTGAIGRRVSG